jgi:hypothetical protein
MPHNIIWVDELICSHQHVTTDELCSIPSFSKGSVMIVAEEVVCSKVFTQWVTRMLMDAYRETRLLLIFCTSMTLELRVSYHRLSCGLKPGSAILNLNLNQSGYWQIGATWYPNKEGEIQMCYQLTSCGYICLGWNRFHSCELVAKGDNSDLQHLYWNPKNSKSVPFSRLFYKKNVWDVA